MVLPIVHEAQPLLVWLALTWLALDRERIAMGGGAILLLTEKAV